MKSYSIKEKKSIKIVLYEWHIVWSQENCFNALKMPVFFENNKVIIAARIITETHEITMKKIECDWHKLSMCEDGT